MRVTAAIAFPASFSIRGILSNWLGGTHSLLLAGLSLGSLPFFIYGCSKIRKRNFNKFSKMMESNTEDCFSILGLGTSTRKISISTERIHYGMNLN